MRARLQLLVLLGCFLDKGASVPDMQTGVAMSFSQQPLQMSINPDCFSNMSTILQLRMHEVNNESIAQTFPVSVADLPPPIEYSITQVDGCHLLLSTLGGAGLLKLNLSQVERGKVSVALTLSDVTFVSKASQIVVLMLLTFGNTLYESFAASRLNGESSIEEYSYFNTKQRCILALNTTANADYDPIRVTSEANITQLRVVVPAFRDYFTLEAGFQVLVADGFTCPEDDDVTVEEYREGIVASVGLAVIMMCYCVSGTMVSMAVVSKLLWERIMAFGFVDRVIGRAQDQLDKHIRMELVDGCSDESEL